MDDIPSHSGLFKALYTAASRCGAINPVLMIFPILTHRFIHILGIDHFDLARAVLLHELNLHSVIQH